MSDRLIAYARVSTARQGVSGLGLEAQQQVLSEYIVRTGGTLLGTFIEVESGRRSDRPELMKALEACRRERATLVIAKLDRLARSVAFVANLMETGVEFVALDAPFANRLMVHILAAFAEHERREISARTKSALAAAKARGVTLGSHGRVLAAQHQARALTFARKVRPQFEAARAAGAITLAEVAAILNERDVPSPEGARWHATSVSRVERRLRTSELAPAWIGPSC